MAVSWKLDFPSSLYLQTKVQQWTGQTGSGRRVRLRDLHIVLAVAESGSMAKASAKLSISHPVVSKAISELEQTLGCQPV